MEIPEMWCIVCRKLKRPSVQIASLEYGGWYCGYHTREELVLAKTAGKMGAMEAGLKSFQQSLLDLDGADIPRYHKDDLLDDQILKIFGGRCIRCGRRTVVVHEIVPKSHGDEYLAADNRVPLCSPCHEWAHSNTTTSIPMLTERRKKVLQNKGIQDE